MKLTELENRPELQRSSRLLVPFSSASGQRGGISAPHLWASCQGSLIKFPGTKKQCQRNLPDGIAEPRQSRRDFSLPITLARPINVTTITIIHPPLRLESTARATTSRPTETSDRMPRSD